MENNGFIIIGSMLIEIYSDVCKYSVFYNTQLNPAMYTSLRRTRYPNLRNRFKDITLHFKNPEKKFAYVTQSGRYWIYFLRKSLSAILVNISMRDKGVVLILARCLQNPI